MPNLPWNEEEPKTISESYIISFDIGENMNVPTAVVAKQSNFGFHIINIFTEDDAITLFETLIGEDFKP